MTFKSLFQIKSTKRLTPVIIVFTLFFTIPTKAQTLRLEKRRKHKLVDTITEIIKPDSIHVKNRNYQFFDSTATMTRFALGGALFAGTSVFQGNISKYFTNPYYFGIQINFHFNRVIFQIDDYIGFCKAKQTMTFAEQLQWPKNLNSVSVAIGLNMGYSLIERQKINVSLFTGFGTNLMGGFKNSSNQDNEPSLPYYKIGSHIDFKNVTMGDDHVRINDVDVYYTSLRISFGYNYPTYKTRYSEYFYGGMFYFSIGIGGIQRGYCSPDQCRF